MILDVRLPGTSGLDLQDMLTRLDVRIPVILMTGYGDVPMTVRGMKAGALDFLTKPFREQEMLDAWLRLSTSIADNGKPHGSETRSCSASPG